MYLLTLVARVRKRPYATRSGRAFEKRDALRDARKPPRIHATTSGRADVVARAFECPALGATTPRTAEGSFRRKRRLHTAYRSGGARRLRLARG